MDNASKFRFCILHRPIIGFKFENDHFGLILTIVDRNNRHGTQIKNGHFEFLFI